MIKSTTFVPYGITAVKTDAIPGAYIVTAATATDRVSKRIILGN